MASASDLHDIASAPNITSSTGPRLNPQAAAFMPQAVASSSPSRRSSLDPESPSFFPSSLASTGPHLHPEAPDFIPQAVASSPSRRRSSLNAESPPFVPSSLASSSGSVAAVNGSSDPGSSSRSKSEIGSEPAASLPKPASSISRTLSPTSIASPEGGVPLDNDSSDPSSQAASSSNSSSSTTGDSEPDPESPTFVPQRARLNHDDEDCETCDGYYPRTQARAPATTSKAPEPEPPSPTPSPPPEKESPPPVNPYRFQINVLRSGGPNLPALPVRTIPMTHANVDAHTASRIKLLGQRAREILTSRSLVWSNTEAVARSALNNPHPTP
ncbi:hypothetical protein BJY01DRAFT_253518 [Aspergillus pseudoustus]|uniref:Uncharacterized protein n=1 Tax=Aspergillus pseudoustus TaxID=1810923 RepID=A0ABR4J0A3_9EURO